MQITVTLTFTEAWEQLNATEQRLQLLAQHAERFPDDDRIVAAMGRLISGRDKLRESMSLADRDVVDALIASLEPTLPDIALAEAGYASKLDEYQMRGA